MDVTHADPVSLIELWLWEQSGRPPGCANVFHRQAVELVAELDRWFDLRPRPNAPRAIDTAAIRRAVETTGEPTVLD